MPLSQDPKYWQKSKAIFSPEQNYFALFAMRYPVEQCSAINVSIDEDI